jgi:PAS domain S-box-containing protein
MDVPQSPTAAPNLADDFPRAIFECSIDGLICIDESGIVRAINPAAERLFGWAEAELVGRNINVLMPEPYASAHDGYLENYRNTGVKKIIGIGREVVARRRDGTNFPVELSVAEAHLPVGLLFVGTVRDISERKRSEAHILRQASLLDAVREAVVVCDADGRVAFWYRGAEAMFGRSAKEMLGRRFTEVLPDRDVALDAQLAVEREGEFHHECEYRTPDRRTLTLECHWSRIREEDDRPAGFLVLCIDATEKRTLKTRALRAQRLESIGVLAGGVAHDLNNVLTPIAMTLKLLRKDRPEAERQELLDTAQSSLDRGAAMLKQLLTFAGGGAGKLVPSDAGKLIREVVGMLARLLPKNVAVTLDVADRLWHVNGDSTQLVQVLMNLVVNARDAMPDGGSLHIHARNMPWSRELATKFPRAKPGPYVGISVADTGVGIARDVLDRIFDPFFTTKKFGEGTGLGLSTALGIVRGHGGFMDVYSEVGVGTRMLVYLPALGLSEPIADADDASATPTVGAGELILAVDDEPAILKTTRMLLESHGYRVVTAENGEQAVAVFQGSPERIHAVVIDVMMPRMDGHAAIKAIRELDAHVAIVSVSGLANPERVSALKTNGGDAFLQKPFSDEELLGALARLLRP